MLILKSQKLNDKELLEYAQSLSLEEGDIKDKLLHWDFGPLMEMKYDPKAQNYLFSKEKVPFHWDGAFFREPLKLLFYCTESSTSGGETLFTNTEKIWESLPQEIREECLKVTLSYRTEKKAHYGGVIHVPLVQKHPTSGKMILRLAERVHTQMNPVELEISGSKRPEELYQYLKNMLYHPDFVYEHKWEEGDLIVVDNFTYLHGRKALGANEKRSFKRIQIL
ncbi:MAG: TauD/TfdA family dioxygenase [Bacteriovoracaceae bacterium]